MRKIHNSTLLYSSIAGIAGIETHYLSFQNDRGLKLMELTIPIMCTIECSPEIQPFDSPCSAFCFQKANYDEIREHLSQINFAAIFSLSTDDMVSHLYGIIYDIFERFVPKSSIRKTYKPKWHNKQLSHLKNLRNKHYKQLCFERKIELNGHGILPSIKEFNFIPAKNEYECLRNSLFSNFLRDQADNVKTNPKLFWRHINSKRSNNSIPSSMKFGDKTASTDIEKSELFAEFFQSVYSLRARAPPFSME